MRLVVVGQQRSTHAVLPVTAALSQALADGVRAGAEEAAGWARIHPTGSTNRFGRDALASIGPAPVGEAQAAELRDMHAIHATRTPELDQVALRHDADAGWSTWLHEIDRIGRTQGAEQARRAERLMRESVQRTDAVVGDAKRSYGRQRPYEVDDTITTVVPRPYGNASYPSGHASGAYSAAIILAAFDPERAAELMATAEQVAFSRVYGGVHFPSDVVTGARIASRVAADVLRRHGMLRASNHGNGHAA